MAAHWYPEGIDAVMTGTIDPDTSDLRVQLVDATYTYNTAHDNLDDVVAGNRVGTAGALASKTIIDNGNSRVLDAADLTFTALTGDPVTGLVIYLHTGVESTSRLLAYIDGIAITPDGSDVTLRWNASGILEITYV
ncbi:MAG: bacteriophage protein [Polyangiaceae bacterium]